MACLVEFRVFWNKMLINIMENNNNLKNLNKLINYIEGSKYLY